MQVNTVVLSGNITRDAELKEFPNSSVVKFGFAFHQGRGKNETTGFIDVEKWGDGTGALAQHLTKGKGLVLEGRLKMDSWEKDGKRHSKPVLVVNTLHFVPKSEKKPETVSNNEDNSGADAPFSEDFDEPPF